MLQFDFFFIPHRKALTFLAPSLTSRTHHVVQVKYYVSVTIIIHQWHRSGWSWLVVLPEESIQRNETEEEEEKKALAQLVRSRCRHKILVRCGLVDLEGHTLSSTF